MFGARSGFYWTEGSIWSLSGGFKRLQVDAGQWVVWGRQGREGGGWVYICACRYPFLCSWYGLRLILGSPYAVRQYVRRPEIHVVFLSVRRTGNTGDGQFHLKCVRCLLSIASCRADHQYSRNAGHSSKGSNGRLGLKSCFGCRIYTLSSVDNNQTWCLKDNSVTLTRDTSHIKSNQ